MTGRIEHSRVGCVVRSNPRLAEWTLPQRSKASEGPRRRRRPDEVLGARNQRGATVRVLDVQDQIRPQSCEYQIPE